MNLDRILKGDWRSAAIVAGPTVLVAYVLGLLGSSYLIWTRSSLHDQAFGIGGHTNAGFFRSAFTLTGMAFGTPVFNHLDGGDSGSTQAGMAPLTITLLTVAAFVYLLRRYDVADNYRDRVDTAIRASLITAAGLAFLTIGMWGSVDGIHQSASPTRVFFWSLLGFVLVSGLASLRTSELTERQQAIWTQWRLPIHGAVAAVTTAIVLGGIAGIIIITAQVEGNRTDVLKALPILLAYLVNLGIDVLHISVGASLHESAGFGDVSVSLFHRHGLSAEYFLLLLLPPIAIAAGITWIRRHRAGLEPQAVAKACYWMALPAAVLFFIIALPSRVGFGFSGEEEFGASGHLGVQLFVGTLIAFGWFLVLGFLVGQVWLSRDITGTSGKPPQPPRTPAWLRGSAAAAPLAIIAGIVGVLVSAGGVATAKSGVHPADLGPVSNITMYDELSAESGTEQGFGGASGSTGAQSFTTEPATPVPATPEEAGVPDSDTVNALVGYETAEGEYFTQHHTYTNDPSELSNLPNSSELVLIIRADTSSLCIQTTDSNGVSWHYDHVDYRISEGTC